MRADTIRISKYNIQYQKLNLITEITSNIVLIDLEMMPASSSDVPAVFAPPIV